MQKNGWFLLQTPNPSPHLIEKVPKTNSPADSAPYDPQSDEPTVPYFTASGAPPLPTGVELSPYGDVAEASGAPPLWGESEPLGYSTQDERLFGAPFDMPDGEQSPAEETQTVATPSKVRTTPFEVLTKEELMRRFPDMARPTPPPRPMPGPGSRPVPSQPPKPGPHPHPPRPQCAPSPRPLPGPNFHSSQPRAQQPSVSTSSQPVMASQTMGENGPTSIQDGVLHERLENFVRSQGIRRIVHTKGYGAIGHFTPYRSMAPYTMLSFLQDPRQTTPVISRFSLAVSSTNTPDTSRNIRGFSTRFYTPDGIFDLLTNHIPVFSVQDALNFPAAIEAFFPSPENGLPDPNRFWSFVQQFPESMLFVLWLYSDRGTLKSFRRMRTYGVNTYVWKNQKGERRFVKYHWIPLLSEECITRQEAQRLAAQHPHIAGQDLHDTLAQGIPVEYELCVQLMDPADAQTLSFNPLDDTKIWEETDYPLLPVGRLTLDENPSDYHTQVEQLAFSPAHLLEGAEFSDDKMLQGRSFIYSDAQRFRLGNEYQDIPVNRPPENAFKPVISENGQQVEDELPQDIAARYDPFTQAGKRYRALPPIEQEHLIDNLASELVTIDADLFEALLPYFTQADPELSERLNERVQYYRSLL